MKKIVNLSAASQVRRQRFGDAMTPRKRAKGIWLAGVLAAIGMGCAKEEVGDPPPTDALHYPVSLALSSDESGTAKYLYVASSNFDLLYNRGTVLAVDLSAYDPEASDASQPLSALVDKDKGWVTMDSFAGKMALSPDGKRLFIPTRSDHRLVAVDVEGNGGQLNCVLPDKDVEKHPQRCHGLKLSKDDVEPTDPFALAFHQGALYVTHGTRPDNGSSYLDSMLVRLNPVTLDGIAHISIGPAPSEDIIETPVGLYFSGKAVRHASEALRFLVSGQVVDAGVTVSTGIQEGRGLGLSADGTRLYMLTRGTRATNNVPSDGPDGLLAVDISVDDVTGMARNQALSFTPLPEGASQMTVIHRSGKRDLLAISCTDSDQVVFFDDELGIIAASVDVLSPYGIVQTPLPDGGVRLFVASFKDDSVQVIDVDDLFKPEAARKRHQLK